MAVPTPCQTPGAQFHIQIGCYGTSVRVDYGRVLDLGESEAELLEANLHNAVELVLAPYFIKQLYSKDRGTP